MAAGGGGARARRGDAVALEELKAEFSFIEYFERGPEGPGVSAIGMIGSPRTVIDMHYAPGGYQTPDEEGAPEGEQPPEEQQAPKEPEEPEAPEEEPEEGTQCPNQPGPGTPGYLGEEAQEVGAMHETSAYEAGLYGQRHHVLPQDPKLLPFFQERGFPGRDIDAFTVELSEGIHQAIHGGGDWKLARKVWEGEWNKRVMTELEAMEEDLGRKLTREEILDGVRPLMQEYGIDEPFVDYCAPR